MPARTEFPGGSDNERYRYTVKLQTKKGLAVTTAALALVLPLTACGSDDEGTSGGLSTAAEAPAASAANSSTEASAEKPEKSEKSEKSEKKTSKTSEKEKKEKEKKKEENKDDKNKSNQAQGGEEQPPTLVNPFENGMPENTNQPLANGEAGSEDDRREMEDTARAVLNPGSFADWTPTILENSCKAVTEPMLEELERQGMSLEQVKEASRLAEEQGQGIELPETEVSLDDVRIDGDRASASLTAKSEHGEETSTMIFQKEDGRWKLCN